MNPNSNIRRRWVLKNEERNFFLCAAGEDPRAALCVFSTKEGAEEHLGGLTEPKLYLDCLERYGTDLPGWMSEEALTPTPTEVSREDLKNILKATGLEYVALTSEEEPGSLEVIPAEDFMEGARE